ncbi:MAG: hypothetical protein M0004_12710 [Actinomycetota bacterium]|nr:hypothetical protein [Actinomycetota bacterium]
MSSRVLDLDRLTPAALNALGLGELEAIVAAIARLRDHERVDPELRSTVLRRIGEALAAGRITVAQATAIRAELDEAVPIAVLTGHFAELTPPELLNKPTIGYYRKAFPREARAVPDISAWYREDPERLRGVVAEMARFCSDWKRIAAATAEIADRAEIPETVADEVIAAVIRQLREAGSRVG